MYELKYRRQARNYLARLPLKIKSAIVNNLHHVAANPDNPSLDIDVLKGKKGFRLRVGHYRNIYTRQDDRLLRRQQDMTKPSFPRKRESRIRLDAGSSPA